jgi:hypothetical protein
MKLSSVLLSLLLAQATLVQAHGGDGGKNGKTNACLRFSTLLSVTDQSDLFNWHHYFCSILPHSTTVPD